MLLPLTTRAEAREISRLMQATGLSNATATVVLSSDCLLEWMLILGLY